jgi:hypothetical protein
VCGGLVVDYLEAEGESIEKMHNMYVEVDIKRILEVQKSTQRPLHECTKAYFDCGGNIDKAVKMVMLPRSR